LSLNVELAYREVEGKTTKDNRIMKDLQNRRSQWRYTSLKNDI